ncbi:MAG TPA: hypothetical protein GX708_01250 [Gallicola sp.]|nr:hypothetical protein [Gallicola sp.]
MELKDLTEEQELKIINKDLVAMHKHTKEKIIVNELGCEYLSLKLAEIKKNEKEIKELELKIQELKEANRSNYQIVGDLYRLKFCDLTTKHIVRDKLTGRVIETKLGHSDYCRNSEKGGAK